MWKDEYKEVSTKSDVHRGQQETVLPFQDQSSPQLMMKVQGSRKYKQKELKENGIGLLGLIYKVMCSVGKHLQPQRTAGW